jgi:hypothetical protein
VGADRWLEIREELRGQDLSFTEIAKVVGERWQILPADVREACEQQANAAKEKYYAELGEYKKTPEYALYQEYLAEFKAKHGGTRVGMHLNVQLSLHADRGYEQKASDRNWSQSSARRRFQRQATQNPSNGHKAADRPLS